MLQYLTLCQSGAIVPCPPSIPPQNEGQVKFPELITGASGGTHIPTAVTQCTCVVGVLMCGGDCVHDEYITVSVFIGKCNLMIFTTHWYKSASIAVKSQLPRSILIVASSNH